MWSDRPDAAPDMARMVAEVRNNDPVAMEVLYSTLIDSFRSMLRRQLSADVEDRAHNVFLITVDAIRSGHIRDPERLAGFVRTVARRQAIDAIRGLNRQRRAVGLDSSVPLKDESVCPERRLIQKQQWACFDSAFRALGPRDREILERSYLRDESRERICREMGLTETQFRLLKNRAKNRLGLLGRRVMMEAALTAYAGKGKNLTDEELNGLIDELGLRSDVVFQI